MTKETKLVKLLDEYDEMKTQLFIEHKRREELIERYKKTEKEKFYQGITEIACWGVEQDNKIKRHIIEKIFEIVNE